jgi:hypothetical protein
VNKGPACCIGKPYWGVTKKMCDVDQYEAPPMDGSKEDSQASCTRNPYWGAAKKACGVNQGSAHGRVEGWPGGGASGGGARTSCDERRADRRVGACSSGGARGCNGTDGALTGGGGSLKGGDGRSQGGRSNVGGS